MRIPKGPHRPLKTLRFIEWCLDRGYGYVKFSATLTISAKALEMARRDRSFVPIMRELLKRHGA